MRNLDKAAIFQCRDLPVRRVEVPEWDGFVFVRTLTGAERDAFEASTVKLKGPSGRIEPNLDNIRGRLVALCACDERGARLFLDDDANELGRLGGAAIDRVFSAAQEHNGLTPRAVEEAKGN